MAHQARAAVILVLGAALALGACGRKGPLDPPGAPQSAPQDAPDGTPNPAPKPDEATILKRPTPVPLAKPDAAQPKP